MSPSFVLVSHQLCPYVQRAAIVLREKRLPFRQVHIDLANKPDWFLKVSPLGKTPVLMVGSEAIFESAVICEYLEEVAAPHLHPKDPLDRARHRSWVEFGSSLLQSIGAFYGSPDDVALQARARDVRQRLEQVERVLDSGPYFAGAAFSVVDAAFGPVFRYFDAFEAIDDFGFTDGLPKVRRWRAALAERSSVAQAVGPDYPTLLRQFLSARGSALSRRIASAGAKAGQRSDRDGQAGHAVGFTRHIGEETPSRER